MTPRQSSWTDSGYATRQMIWEERQWNRLKEAKKTGTKSEVGTVTGSQIVGRKIMSDYWDGFCSIARDGNHWDSWGK